MSTDSLNPQFSSTLVEHAERIARPAGGIGHQPRQGILTVR
jgi:hypothetical protein